MPGVTFPVCAHLAKLPPSLNGLPNRLFGICIVLSVLLFDLSKTQGREVPFPREDTFTWFPVSRHGSEPSAV